jgi:hypothetical protein
MDYIRASELSEYAFCAQAWWLHRVEGVEPDDDRPLRAGEAWHSDHGRRVWLAGVLQGAAILVGLAALALALVGGATP